MTLTYGGVPVPYTVSWTNEEAFHIALCPHANAPAICQAVAPGIGKPRFGTPHSQRQREAIARGLCDLCGKPLRNRTKVSLSHARVRNDAADGPAVLQVEPLLHRECARECVAHCPSLRRDTNAGTLMVRQVTSYRVQFAIMDEIYTEEIAGERRRAVGHAKVELRKWIDRDHDWLGEKAW